MKNLLLALSWSICALPASADSFDSTSKVAAAYTDGYRYTCGINSSPSNTIRCDCSPNGTTWTPSSNISTGGTLYQYGGVYFVPGVSGNSGENYFFFVKDTGLGKDEIEEYSVNNSSCTVTRVTGAIFDNTGRAGPRLAAALDSASPANAWNFWVEASNSHNPGHLWAAALGHQGKDGYGGTISDLTFGLGNNQADRLDPGTPIAASHTNIPNADVFVAGRKQSDSSRIAVVLRRGGNWIRCDSPALPVGGWGIQTTVGNSIAIVSNPAQHPPSIDTYEWVAVIGSNYRIYETQLQVVSGVVSLGSWVDLGYPGYGADSSRDGLAATWYTDAMNGDRQVIYVHTLFGGAQTVDVAALNPGAGSWTDLSPPNATYGYQTMIMIRGGSPKDEWYGLCDDQITAGKIDTCRMTRTPGNNVFSWTNALY